MVRPLAGVQPKVILEAGRACETFLALGTVKLLPEVDFLVFPQAAGLVEAPVAHGAVERPLPGVREPVPVHGARVSEALAAFGAGEWLFARVDFKVTFELTFLRELFSTHGALIGFFSRMNPHVDLKRGHLVAVPPTEPTAVSLLWMAVALFLNWRFWKTIFFAARIFSRRCR